MTKRWDTQRIAIVGALFGLAFKVVTLALLPGPASQNPDYRFGLLIGGLIGGAVGWAAIFAAISGLRNLYFRAK